MTQKTTFWFCMAALGANAIACEVESQREHEAGGGGMGAEAGAESPPNAGKGGTLSDAGHSNAGSPAGGRNGGTAPMAGEGGSSGAPAGGVGGDDNQPEPWQLRVLTYNSALAPDFEPYSNERKSPIEHALAEAATELDVLCVQEYWAEDDFASLQTAVQGELPHALRQEAKPGSGSCTLPDLGLLGGCLETKCPSTTGIELVACAQTQCATEIQTIDGGCLGCMLEHLGDGAFAACAASVEPSDPALFGGTFDVGMLSRYEPTETHVLEYDSYFVRASALHERIDVPGQGLVDAFCTHLGSSLGVIPYQGPHGSWEGEHAYQTAQLLSFINARAGAGHPIVVLGDLNAGLSHAGPPAIEAEAPLDYRLLTDAGLGNALATPVCTMCPDNVLRGPSTRPLFLDHVLVKGFGGQIVADLALTETFTLGEGPDAPAMNLSDHYGVRVRLGSE